MPDCLLDHVDLSVIRGDNPDVRLLDPVGKELFKELDDEVTLAVVEFRFLFRLFVHTLMHEGSSCIDQHEWGMHKLILGVRIQI
jgi:hypothetical protein